MVLEDLKPRQILTPGAFRNAVASVLAVSGSINCIKHLQATAVESGLDLDVFQLFNDLGDSVPVLSAVRPNGEDTIEDFEAAGGAHALLKQLAPLLDTQALTVTGKTLADNLKDAVVATRR
jgi:dihydroxy-acid dehydratase